MSDENLNFNEVDESQNFNETNDESGSSENLALKETNETDGIYEDGNFNETTGDLPELKENSTEDYGNFNEVEDFTSDSSEGNFKETDANGNVPDNTGSYNNGSTGPISYSPVSTPQKNGSSKVLVGVIVALALVIVGLIIFLVVGLLKDKNKDKTNNTTPTETVINIDGSEITGTVDNNGSNSGNSGETYEVPKFDITCELGQYKGIEVEYQVQEVTDEDVEGALTYFTESLTEKQAIADRPLEEGDIIVMDYVGTMDGEVFDGGSATGAELTLGSHLYISGFEEGLIGKNVGDSVSLDLHFPDPYPNNLDYSGKAVNFLVNINEAYIYVTPELTDELVANNSEYKTIEEYRNAAREELEKQAEQYAESQLDNDIIKKVIENATFGGQIDEQIAWEVEDCIDYYDSICQQQFGVDGVTYFSYLWGITGEEYLAMVNEESTMSVKYNAVLDEIVKKENLTCSDEEFEAMFQETFMDYYGFTSKEEVYAQIGEDTANETVRGYVLHDKAEAIIKDSAVIKNKPE